MKLIRKYAEFIGYILIHGERFDEWRCPNKKCSFSVCEDYKFCPHCGQKLKFGALPDVKTIKLQRKERKSE